MADVVVERDGVIARVCLSRPERLNALTAAMLDELREAWRLLAADPRLRCVILTGAGRGFCAGADMDLLASDRADARDTAAEELSFLPGERVDVPVIAAINGTCAGAGLHFVADADIALAAASASFLDPHVAVGQVSALEPVTLLLRMRPDMLRRMVLLAHRGRLDAEAAYACGLVSEVVADERLAARATELAEVVCEGSPTAIARSRRLLRGFEAKLMHEYLEEAWTVLCQHRSHPDALEGPAAFAERRAPRWEPRAIDHEVGA